MVRDYDTQYIRKRRYLQLKLPAPNVPSYACPAMALNKEEVLEVAQALAASTGIPLAEAVFEVYAEMSGASAQSSGEASGASSAQCPGEVVGVSTQFEKQPLAGGSSDTVGGVSTQVEEKESVSAGPDLGQIAEAEQVAVEAGAGGGSPQKSEATAAAPGDLSQHKPDDTVVLLPPHGEGQIVPYTADREAVLCASSLLDLDFKVRNRLHQMVNRRLQKDNAPKELVAKWTAAKGDRFGVKQLAILREWAKDPSGFGQATVRESHENTQSCEADRLHKWVSRDDLEGKFHYLPPDARKAKVDEYVASAKGTRKHPALKGEFEYRVYLGETEHDKKSTARSRQVAVEAMLAGDLGASALDAMAREGAEVSRGLKRNVSEASEASAQAKKSRGKAKAKGASAQETTASEQQHKLLTATVKKVAADLGGSVGELSSIQEEREQSCVKTLEPHRKFCADLLLELEGLRPRAKTCSEEVQKAADKWEAQAATIRRHLEEAKPMARAAAKARKAAASKST